MAGWRDGDLSNAAWRRLEPDLRLAQDVHLQGWGEPLLDAQLSERARAAHEAGCSVGLTTNALALTDAADWIAALPVDRVVVSVGANLELDGGRPSCALVPAARDGLIALARARHGRRPRLLVSVLLTYMSVPLLPGIVDEAAHAGADEVFLTHVDCTPGRNLLAQAVFSGGGLAADVAAQVEAAAVQARRFGIRFRPPAPRAEELLVCALDPREFAFVSWDGQVGPCVHLRLPIEGRIPRYDRAGKHEAEAVSWGRLPGESLADILQCAARQAFIAPFEARLRAERHFRSAGRAEWGVEALEDLERADQARERALAAAPFPPACRGCHKARGW